MPLDPHEPVTIVQSDPGWAFEFTRLRTALCDALGDIVVEHIGSTAVPGLPAKAILDIVIVLDDPSSIQTISARLESIGYAREGEKDVAGRHSFKRLTSATPKSGSGPWLDHHLYLSLENSEFIAMQRIFRDYLIGHPQTADRYGVLKKSLADAYGSDRVRYTEAKGPFVRAVLASARGETIQPGLADAIDVDQFFRVDMRVGTVIAARRLPRAHRPAIVMTMDFGEAGILTSSAQVTDYYSPEELLGRQAVAVVNLPARQVGSVMSRCLVLGASDGAGIVLLAADKAVPNGARIH